MNGVRTHNFSGDLRLVIMKSLIYLVYYASYSSALRSNLVNRVWVTCIQAKFTTLIQTV